ncbi:MAG: ferritin family protein [Phycisphaerae bacterium]|jgi:rubrerythrin
MTIEEAIQTAIAFENQVRDVYTSAAEKASDATGERVFRVLADEEQRHVDYLEARLSEWRETGSIHPSALDTVVPSRDVLAEAASRVAEGMADVDRGTELAMLSKALEAERKTSSFYRKMVAELPAEGQQLFERFVTIEDGHLAIVQAEMDSLTGTGAWFDCFEVKL